MTEGEFADHNHISHLSTSVFGAIAEESFYRDYSVFGELQRFCQSKRKTNTCSFKFPTKLRITKLPLSLEKVYHNKKGDPQKDFLNCDGGWGRVKCDIIRDVVGNRAVKGLFWYPRLGWETLLFPLLTCGKVSLLNPTTGTRIDPNISKVTGEDSASPGCGEGSSKYA
ncbi:hypothetical protein AVEN_231116-1 [Araneus ventricosus]|uniref:Uncharacterized protein n=1 Tax=Araneus ventricosus TaxID=182803 RepID=A0A4Y2J7V5_ARAVE|nr:hypothetical protein AVEN_231116-1 [Araneus ventricosus]